MLLKKVVKAAKALKSAFQSDCRNAAVCFFQKPNCGFQPVDIDKLCKGHIECISEIAGSVVVIISQFLCNIRKRDAFCMVLSDVFINDRNCFCSKLSFVDQVDLIDILFTDRI